jgi:cyclase
MKNIRVIARLDIKGPNLVKGVHLEGLRVLGKPEDFAFKYYSDGADELIYMDVVASLYGRNNLLETVRTTAKNIFIPLTVGGGIRTIEDIRSLLRAGADKVAINTAAIANPKLITQGAKLFGSQCIVVSIEAKKKEDGGYEAYTDNGRQRTGVNVFEWARQVVDLGAGEILLTSIDREGTGKGFDIELTREISESVPIPIIACGGAGKKEDFLEASEKAKADALCAASVFHYNRLYSIDLESEFKEEGNVEFLKRDPEQKRFLSQKIIPISISYLKTFLDKEGVSCRTTHTLKVKNEV